MRAHQSVSTRPQARRLSVEKPGALPTKAPGTPITAETLRGMAWACSRKANVAIADSDLTEAGRLIGEARQHCLDAAALDSGRAGTA